VTTVVLASTLYGVATAVTILDNEPPSKSDHRILVVANNAPLAEIVPDLTEIAGFAAVAERFDEVVSLNALIAPYHPSEWRPTTEDVVVLARLVRSAWGIGGEPVRVFLESIQVRPAQTLATLFPDAPITVYADGLMSYAPTRNVLTPEI
jgi:Alpha-2,8-polysialyltransferase (POLYST)